MQITPKTLVCYIVTSRGVTVLEECDSKQEAIEFIKNRDMRNSTLENRPLFLIDATKIEVSE